MTIYNKLSGVNLYDINNEKLDESYIPIQAETIDEYFDELIKKKINFDENLREKLDSYFEDSACLDIDSFQIKHWVSNRSFGELIDMYVEGEIKKPDMQRSFIWDSVQRSRLIESIIVGLPIPPLFLMEVNTNEYEIIDGYQRLSTLVKFVKGFPWNEDSKQSPKSKLSSKVMKSIRNKSFEELEPEYKRKIKRSTIPLIEFSQIKPDNFSAKYLIFERINTGSVKLNNMQIRKSLATGNFMNSLYKFANSNTDFLKMFSIQSIKKDNNVEAFLRIYVMKKIWEKEYNPESSGIKNILDEYCEKYRNKQIEPSFFQRFNDKISEFKSSFNDFSNFGKKVSKENNEYEYTGQTNIAIVESVLGVAISKYEIKINNEFETKYKDIIHKQFDTDLTKKEDNPFSFSTGKIEYIKKRFDIFNSIIGD